VQRVGSTSGRLAVPRRCANLRSRENQGTSPAAGPNECAGQSAKIAVKSFLQNGRTSALL
jgi:hypothetical protein